MLATLAIFSKKVRAQINLLLHLRFGVDLAF